MIGIPPSKRIGKRLESLTHRNFHSSTCRGSVWLCVQESATQIFWSKSWWSWQSWQTLMYAWVPTKSKTKPIEQERIRRCLLWLGWTHLDWLEGVYLDGHAHFDEMCILSTCGAATANWVKNVHLLIHIFIIIGLLQCSGAYMIQLDDVYFDDDEQNSPVPCHNEAGRHDW